MRFRLSTRSGKIRGEELPHHRSLGHADEVRAVPAHCIHHGQEILVPLLKRRCFVESVRQPDAALVERDAGHVLSVVL